MSQATTKNTTETSFSPEEREKKEKELENKLKYLNSHESFGFNPNEIIAQLPIYVQNNYYSILEVQLLLERLFKFRLTYLGKEPYEEGKSDDRDYFITRTHEVTSKFLKTKEKIVDKTISPRFKNKTTEDVETAIYTLVNKFWISTASLADAILKLYDTLKSNDVLLNYFITVGFSNLYQQFLSAKMCGMAAQTLESLIQKAKANEEILDFVISLITSFIRSSVTFLRKMYFTFEKSVIDSFNDTKEVQKEEIFSFLVSSFIKALPYLNSFHVAVLNNFLETFGKSRLLFLVKCIFQSLPMEFRHSFHFYVNEYMKITWDVIKEFDFTDTMIQEILNSINEGISTEVPDIENDVFYRDWPCFLYFTGADFIILNILKDGSYELSNQKNKICQDSFSLIQYNLPQDSFNPPSLGVDDDDPDIQKWNIIKQEEENVGNDILRTLILKKLSDNDIMYYEKIINYENQLLDKLETNNEEMRGRHSSTRYLKEALSSNNSFFITAVLYYTSEIQKEKIKKPKYDFEIIKKPKIRKENQSILQQMTFPIFTLSQYQGFEVWNTRPLFQILNHNFQQYFQNSQVLIKDPSFSVPKLFYAYFINTTHFPKEERDDNTILENSDENEFISYVKSIFKSLKTESPEEKKCISKFFTDVFGCDWE